MTRLGTALAIAALTLSCAGPIAAAPTASVTPASGPTAPAAGPSLGPRQQHEGGPVTVAASWIVGTASARVVMDTHSIDLDGADLKELARVRLDGGGWVSPTLWDAPKGGHHRSGTLTFGSLEPRAIAAAAVIELEVRDVGVPSHLLRWERAR